MLRHGSRPALASSKDDYLTIPSRQSVSDPYQSTPLELGTITAFSKMATASSSSRL